MATVRDVLGNDTLKFENQFKQQGLSGIELNSAMVNLARDTRSQRENQQKQTQEQTSKPFELQAFNSDSTGDKIMRGIGEAGTRTIALVNSIGLVPDTIAKPNAKVLDALEKRKEEDSNNSIQFDLNTLKNKKGKNTLDLVEIRNMENRLKDKEALKQESANATGFVDNAVTGIKTLVDTAVHPSEWTAQGIVSGVLDPANALGFGTGAIIGKITSKIGTSMMTKVGLNTADGLAVNAGTEYGVAKGTFKSDEEAKKAAIQAGIAGAAMPVAFSAIGGAYAGVNPKALTPDEVGAKIDTSLNPSEPIPSDPMIKEQTIKDESFSKIINNPLLKDKQTNAPLTPEQVLKKLEDGLNGKEASPEQINTIVDSNIKQETINLVKQVAAAENDSMQIHADTKLKLQEAMQDGASLDEMISIRNNVPMTESETFITKIINNSEPTTPRVSGFRIIGVIEDTIKNSKLNPDEVKQKLINENVSPELATVAAKSYILKDTTMLVDYIQAKVEDHMGVINKDLKTQIEEKTTLYNKQKIADEQLWTTSLTKKSLDDYITKEIGDDNILPVQREMLQDLNKIGLVEDLTSEKLKKNINAQYDVDNNNITLNTQTPKVTKAQALTHEYLHSAFTKLSNEPKFNTELNFLMSEAKTSFKAAGKDINQYGFKTVDEFGAEAFSNPIFARELNEVTLSAKAKEQLGVKQYVNTLWEAIVDKFSEVVFSTTGRRLKLNPDSYLAALDNMFKKQLSETQALQEQRIKDGSAIAQELKQPIESKPTTFDNLKLHPRFNELISMREDVKATDIKYDNKVLNKGTVVHDANKYGGVDKTQVVPTSYERNYNADFKLTKQDIDNIKAGKIDENITQKLQDDLSTLDNHPDWKKYSDDVDINESKNTLGSDFTDSYYINKNGELVDDGKVLFSMNKEMLKKSIGDFKDKYKKSGVKSHVYINSSDEITLGSIQVEKANRNKGLGSKYMEELISIADENNKSIVLTPSSDLGGTLSRLTSFYKNFGFKKNKDYRFKEKMIRTPREVNKSQDSNILNSENFPREKKSMFEKYDSLADKTINSLDNFFKGLNSDGNLKEKTNLGMDGFRKAFVPDAHKSKEFVKLLQENNKEKARQKLQARNLQEDLNKIPKEENALLVMALDGDIPKADIKATLGDQLFEIYTKMRSNIDNNADELVKQGMLDIADKKEDYIKRFYKEHLENKGIISGLFSSGHKLQKNFKRKNLTLEQRNAINQVRDAGYVVARTILEQSNLLRKAKFLNTLADEFSVSEPKLGFVEVPIKKDGTINVFGNLSGKFVPEHVMNELNGLYDFGKTADNMVKKNIKNFSRWLKGTWTAGNISTHLYNVGSNALNLYLNGMIFTTKNGRVGGGSKGVNGIKKFFSKDTREAYKTELTEAGLYDDSFFTALESAVDDLDVKTKDNFGLKDILNGVLFKKDSKITKAIENVYDLEDKVFRVFVYEEKKYDAQVAKYEQEFGKVKNWSEAKAKIEAIELSAKEKLEAMNEARDMFVDYSKPVPQWIQTADNYMIAPFARYTYLATIRQAKTSIQHPFRALALSFGFGEALKAMFGDEDGNLDDNDPLKPEYAKTSYKNFNMYGTQNYTKLGDNKDESAYFNTGRLIPGFRMLDMSLGFYHDLYNVLAKGEGKFGQKLFNDKEPEFIKARKKLSATSEMLLPPLFPIGWTMYEGKRLTEGGNIKEDKDGKPMNEAAVFGGRYGQKLINAKNGIILDRYGKPVPVEDVIKQMFGIKLLRVDKKSEATKQAKTLTDTYKYETNRAKALGEPEKAKEAKKEYDKKMGEIKKAAPGFDLGQKSSSGSDRFNVKFDF